MNSTRNPWALAILAAEIMVSPGFGADIDTNVAPPPPRVEHAPPPRDGFVWAPGHWAWTGKSYNWVAGTWVVQRRHMHWVADQWEQVGEKWHFLPAHWEQS